jgi:hypothetical protein
MRERPAGDNGAFQENLAIFLIARRFLFSAVANTPIVERY